MRDFFKPWRRKAAVVALGIACVTVAGWVRSRDRYDEIQLNTAPWRYSLASAIGQLHLCRMSHLEGRPVFDGILSTRVKAVAGMLVDRNGIPRYEPIEQVEWRYDLFGFHLIEGTDEGIKMFLVSVPYWSLAIPMILLSAYLLLSKRPISRDAEPQKERS